MTEWMDGWMDETDYKIYPQPHKELSVGLSPDCVEKVTGCDF